VLLQFTAEAPSNPQCLDSKKRKVKSGKGKSASKLQTHATVKVGHDGKIRSRAKEGRAQEISMISLYGSSLLSKEVVDLRINTVRYARAMSKEELKTLNMRIDDVFRVVFRARNDKDGIENAGVNTALSSSLVGIARLMIKPEFVEPIVRLWIGMMGKFTPYTLYGVFKQIITSLEQVYTI
jgi:hypothetical protein